MNLPKPVRIGPDHWPAAAAVVLLPAVGFWPMPASSEVARAVASVACILLLASDWNLQRRRIQAWPGLLFSLVLVAPGLAAIWLGLNVVRYYSYAPETPGNLYDVVVHAQSVIQWSGVVVLIAILGLMVVDFSRWLDRRSR